MAIHNQQHEVDPDNTDEIAAQEFDRALSGPAENLPEVDGSKMLNSRLDLFLAGEIDDPHQDLV